MKNFIKIKNYDVKFGDCKNCEAHCCKGLFGTIFSQIIKEEFEEVYKNFPILFIFGSLGFIKPVILLSNGFDSCPYLIINICSIYENRPNVCKTYPQSPNIDNEIYIDTSCPEIYKGKNNLDLQNQIFKNYSEKYINTHLEFGNLKFDDFKKVLSIKGQDFYEYIGVYESIYLNLHKLSLINLEKFI